MKQAAIITLTVLIPGGAAFLCFKKESIYWPEKSRISLKNKTVSKTNQNTKT